MKMKSLRETDPEIWQAIEAEKKRQTEGLELIPSENFASKAVMEAVGSIMTNKYSEGLPGKRYYGGNQYVDIAENLARERAKLLFGCDHVNVQPYSGSPANLSALYALMKLGETLMGMSLAHGGHLTHGASISFSGQYYRSAPYGVSEKTETLDYNEIRALALKEKPKVIITGHSAYPRDFDFKIFREIADEVGAYHMADIAHIAGFIAAGLMQSPIPYCEVVTTTTHKTLRGPRGAMIMCKKEWAEKIDKAVFPTFQGGPHDNVNAAKAVAFKEALQPEFKEYSRQTLKNAKVLADTLLALGYRLVTGGTDNHLILVDLRDKNVSGKEAEAVLDEVGICINKNMIPFDPRKPWDPSGIRLGTPALTTRGMKESEMKHIGELIHKTIEFRSDANVREKIHQEVKELCKRFVFYE